MGLAVTGNLYQWNLGGALKATFWGAVSGAVSFGVGELFSAGSVVKALGEAKFLVQAAVHGVSQGVLSVMQGGDFISGAAGGFFGSLGASAFGGIAGDWANSTGGQVFFGALSGGIGAELSGGNFWQGVVTGGIVAGLNHAMHKLGGDPQKTKKAEKLAEEYKINNYRILGESLTMELLLESTEVGEFTLKALREKIIEIYGDTSIQKANEVYFSVVDIYREINKSIGEKGLTDMIKVKI